MIWKVNYYGQTGPINLNPSLNFFLVAIEMGRAGGRAAEEAGIVKLYIKSYCKINCLKDFLIFLFWLPIFS